MSEHQQKQNEKEYETTPTSPSWEHAELDQGSVEFVRERLERVPRLTYAFQELADGLQQDGSSRTVFRLPVNIAAMNKESAMYNAAREFAEVVTGGGVGDLGGALLVREDETPEDLEEVELHPQLKASIAPKDPIGYVRVEKVEGRTQASVGCLDPTTHTDYSIAL